MVLNGTVSTNEACVSCNILPKTYKTMTTISTTLASTLKKKFMHKVTQLLVTPAWGDEEEQYPFPELIPRKTINCHVSKISP